MGRYQLAARDCTVARSGAGSSIILRKRRNQPYPFAGPTVDRAERSRRAACLLLYWRQRSGAACLPLVHVTSYHLEFTRQLTSHPVRPVLHCAGTGVSAVCQCTMARRPGQTRPSMRNDLLHFPERLGPRARLLVAVSVLWAAPLLACGSFAPGPHPPLPCLPRWCCPTPRQPTPRTVGHCGRHADPLGDGGAAHHTAHGDATHNADDCAAGPGRQCARRRARLPRHGARRIKHALRRQRIGDADCATRHQRTRHRARRPCTGRELYLVACRQRRRPNRLGGGGRRRHRLAGPANWRATSCRPLAPCGRRQPPSARCSAFVRRRAPAPHYWCRCSPTHSTLCLPARRAPTALPGSSCDRTMVRWRVGRQKATAPHGEYPPSSNPASSWSP